MTLDSDISSEESLDPQDWEALRALGHHMLDDMLDYLRTVGERPVWQPVPQSTKDRLSRPAPRRGAGTEQTYREFQEHILPYPLGNIHPRFWGWVKGTGTPTGMLAEMLAAGMNSNVGTLDHGAAYVERQVIDWFKEVLGYPMDAGGVLVSGCSVANLIGLTVARNHTLGSEIRQSGLVGLEHRPVLYASTETHNSVQKAVEVLGLGSDSLRLIPVDAEFRIDLKALQQAIDADRRAGMQPFCIVGNAGTVNTGAFDDLVALADICRREGLWFHVDGAFGALAALVPEITPLTTGMARADSLAFDMHKWMYMPYEAACILIRSEEQHRAAFTLESAYLARLEHGPAAEGLWYSDYGLQLSRGFRALKVWFSLQEHGFDRYARLVRQNVAQARYLAALVDDSPHLERLAPTSLNIVCLRYIPAGYDREALNRLNRRILEELHLSGIAVPSYTILNGNFAIRVAITNHRSRRSDFDLLVSEIERLGGALSTGV